LGIGDWGLGIRDRESRWVMESFNLLTITHYPLPKNR
jgi:hypothetical protein